MEPGPNKLIMTEFTAFTGDSHTAAVKFVTVANLIYNLIYIWLKVTF